MSNNPAWSKVLRIVSLVMMCLTVVFTLLGGIGTTCVALNPGRMNMGAIQTQLMILVVLSILDGIAGIWATIQLFRGARKSYLITLIVLVVGLVTSGIQMYYSATYRPNGATAPNSWRVYVTAITLLLFLVIRLPGIKDKVQLEKGGTQSGSGSTAAGASLFLSGLLTVTTPLWAGPTHMFDGYNMVNLVLEYLVIGGCIMTLTGLFLLKPALPAFKRKILLLARMKA